jgi:DNA-binding protein YbaB
MGSDFEELAARAEAALRSAERSGRGTDESGAVTVFLTWEGRVREVQVGQRWRERLAPAGLGDAVREAVRAATMARFGAWGQSFAASGEPSAASRGSSAAPGESFAGRQVGPAPRRGGFTEDLSRLATRRMSNDDCRTALGELLAILEDASQGLDEALARVEATRAAAYTGHSANRNVTVTVTGGGEVSEVRFHSRWVVEAHEVNIGRQTVEAFQAAYALAARDSAESVISEGRLGRATRATRDPFELATRLRLR